MHSLEPGNPGYVVVVGGANVDIGGRPFSNLLLKDSNPGRVTMSLGGVGRNIAHNLALLGVPVSLLTVLGADLFALRMEGSCRELGIDISSALKAEEGATPTYVYLCDSGGEMNVAVSDMELCERMTPAFLESRLPLLDNAQLVVADTNIPEDSLAFLAKCCAAPLFVDPVSVKKAGKLKDILSAIHTLKPNRMEAGYLSGIEITNRKSLAAAADALLGTGLKRVFISMGEKGVLAAEGEERLFMPCFPAEVENVTGAGDAFMAALAWAYLEKMKLKETMLHASAAAALAVESEETVNPALSEEAMKKRAGEHQ